MSNVGIGVTPNMPLYIIGQGMMYEIKYRVRLLIFLMGEKMKGKILKFRYFIKYRVLKRKLVVPSGNVGIGS